MFAIASPQTIRLPDACTITFRADGDDVSRCVMDVQVEGGDIHTVIFNTRGHMVSQGVQSPPEPVDEPAKDEHSEEGLPAETSHEAAHGDPNAPVI